MCGLVGVLRRRENERRPPFDKVPTSEHPSKTKNLKKRRTCGLILLSMLAFMLVCLFFVISFELPFQTLFFLVLSW